MKKSNEDIFNDSFMQFVKTGNATTKALICLIQDLAPVIGFDEAQRLVDIIGEAQKGGTEE